MGLNANKTKMLAEKFAFDETEDTDWIMVCYKLMQQSNYKVGICQIELDTPNSTPFLCMIFH